MVKGDSDTSAVGASSATGGAATGGGAATTGGTTPAPPAPAPKVIIKYSCMCDPDVVYKNDVLKRLRATNSSTIEEATLEITQACKDIKAGEQEVKLFACSEKL